ncbi:MAG: FHA domain-containing protein [Planctomycetota bacterium]
MNGVATHRLVVLGDGSVRTVPLVGTRWLVGRAQECEVLLRDPTVSRRHVLIERIGDEFLVRDLGGRNPVLIDGKPAASAALRPGQTIGVGLTRLLFETCNQPLRVTASADTVVITSREVIDHELPEEDRNTVAHRARRILERIEWTFADLGSMRDAAEPLLALALNLTQRGQGLIARVLRGTEFEPLAAIDTARPTEALAIPQSVLVEGQGLNQPTLLKSTRAGKAADLLVIPLGNAPERPPEGLIVLGDPSAGAPTGQELLRLGLALGKVVWHRLSEVRERLRLRDEVQRLRFHGSSAHNAVLTSSRLHGVRQTLRELTNETSSVLLIGEEGTEREDLARYLHAEGQRRGHAFISIHVGSLPPRRVETELFGDRRSEGALCRAANGTLFLDGYSQLEPHLQERLHVELSRRGEHCAPDQLPPRLVVATESDPAATSPAARAVADERFPHRIHIPPLRDEPSDAVALAELFLSELGTGPDGNARLLSERARRCLATYSWPGNVRQLRIVLETAAGLAGTQQITPKHLPEEITLREDGNLNDVIPSLEAVEREHIRTTLKRLGGNRARTAATLGIATSTLYEKMRRFGIDA